MLGTRLAVPALAVGLVASPLAALYCDASDAAAMACCQGDMSECNQPGKTEDCCKSGPSSPDAVAIASKAEVKSLVTPLDAGAILPLEPALRLADTLSLLGPKGRPGPHPGSPPRTPILRV